MLHPQCSVNVIQLLSNQLPTDLHSTYQMYFVYYFMGVG